MPNISRINLKFQENILKSSQSLSAYFKLILNDSIFNFVCINEFQVVVTKKRGESLGVMLLESGWGSMLPTVFIAHIANYSPSAICQQLTVGDHILSCNGASLVGLPLSECNTVLRVRLGYIPLHFKNIYLTNFWRFSTAIFCFQQV